MLKISIKNKTRHPIPLNNEEKRVKYVLPY